MESNGNHIYLTRSNGESANIFFIQGISNSGDLSFTIELDKPKDWFPVELFASEQGLFLFYNQINREERSSEMGILVLNPDEEDIKNEFLFDGYKVGEWAGNKTKGATLETFAGAKEGFIDPLEHIPFDYKYRISHSPSKGYHLVYRFDYSRPGLFVNLWWLDANMKMVATNELRIDDSRVNVEIAINDKADIFVLNTDALGLMELIKFDSTLEDFDLLEVSPSHAMRDDFKLRFVSDEEVLVASKVDYEKETEGVFYAKFNFNTEEVERINFFQIEDELKDKVDSISKAEYGQKVDWDEFHLLYFDFFNEEELLLGIEEIGIESQGKKYFPWQIDAPNEFRPTKSAIFDGMIGLFSFNIYDELRWMFWLPKSGKDDINRVAYLPNMSTDFSGGDRISFFYADPKKDAPLRKTNFDYFYAQEPNTEEYSGSQSSRKYLTGISFHSEGKWHVPFEGKNGSSGIESY